jgi:hypothetical protein
MENSVPYNNFFPKVEADKEIKSEQLDSEFKAISQLKGYQPWEALRKRLERKIDAIDAEGRKRIYELEEMPDMRLHGIKCVIRDLLIEAYQGIINEVEIAAYEFERIKKENDIISGNKN